MLLAVRVDRTKVPRCSFRAMEQGEWTCTVAETVTARGSYAAKWRRIGEDWAIEAELFVTLG